MSDLSEIRDMLVGISDRIHCVDKKIESHIAETNVYRQNQTGNTQEHHGTLYEKDVGLVYVVDRLQQESLKNIEAKKMLSKSIWSIGIATVLLVIKAIWSLIISTKTP